MSQQGVPPDLRVVMPSFPIPEHAHQWAVSHHMPTQQYTPRPSWDLAVSSSYADPSSGSAGAGSGYAGAGVGVGVEQHLHQPHSPSHTRGLQPDLSAALPGEHGGKEESAGSQQLNSS